MPTMKPTITPKTIYFAPIFQFKKMEFLSDSAAPIVNHPHGPASPAVRVGPFGTIFGATTVGHTKKNLGLWGACTLIWWTATTVFSTQETPISNHKNAQKRKGASHLKVPRKS
jgi:hypothetical protein